MMSASSSSTVTSMAESPTDRPLTRVGFPNAKLNIGLQVRHRREDGFHALESLFLPIPWCDTLELETLHGGGPSELVAHGLPIQGWSEDNLILRAHVLLSAECDLPPVRFHLVKAIPMGAGLGGGSADGAFALRLLDAHFNLGLSTDRLESLAGELGSDCPFFIRNTPAHVTGRGEHVAPIGLDVKDWWVAVIHPGIHVPTARAFEWVTPSDDREGLSGFGGSNPEQWTGRLHNDFTEAVAERHPEIRDALAHLRNMGAVFSDMSGSGSAVFGFFRSDPGPWSGPEAGTAATWKYWTGRL